MTRSLYYAAREYRPNKLPFHRLCANIANLDRCLEAVPNLHKGEGWTLNNIPEDNP